MGKITFNNLKIRQEREITGAKVHFIYSFPPPPRSINTVKAKEGEGMRREEGLGDCQGSSGERA